MVLVKISYGSYVFLVADFFAMMFQNLRENAILEVDKYMLTDAPLLFPPGQVCFALWVFFISHFKCTASMEVRGLSFFIIKVTNVLGFVLNTIPICLILTTVGIGCFA